MPTTESGTIRFLRRIQAESRKRQGRGGGKEYHIESLPPETQAYLKEQNKENQNNVHGTRKSDSISIEGWGNRIENAARDGGTDSNDQGLNEPHPETESDGEFCNANQRCTTIQDRTYYSEDSLDDERYPTNQNPNPPRTEPNATDFSGNRTSDRLPASEGFDTNSDEVGKREADRISQRDLLVLPNSRRMVGLAKKNPSQANEPAELGVKEARLYLLGQLREFAKNHGLGKCAARYEFSRLYNLGELGIPKWVKAHIKTLSYRSLFEWQKKAREVTKLDNHYGNRKGTGLIDQHPELQKTIKAFADKTPRQIQTKVKERNSDSPLPSEMQIRRWRNKYIAENQAKYDRLTDPNKFHSRSRMAMGSYSESVTYALERIESDATKGDIFLTTDGEKYERYSIVGIIDVFSRREKYFVVKNNNAKFMVQSVLRWMLQNWGWIPPTEDGKPRMSLHVDNGKEFIATEFQEAAINQFGIAVERCQGKSPWQKPFVERSFRTMGDLLEQLPGFCGHNVSERQKIRGQLGDNDVAAMLHPQDLQKLLDSWVSNEYECRKHRGEGLDGKFTPLEKWATTPYEIDDRYAKDNSTLDLLLAPVASRKGLRTVKGNGIEIDNGFYFPKPDSGQFSKWHEWSGRKVLCKFDPVEPYTIHCYSHEPGNPTKTPEYLFTAYDFRNLGWNRKFLAAEAHRSQKESLSEVREMRTVRREEFGKVVPFAPRRKQEKTETAAEKEVRKIQERDKLPEPVQLTPQQKALKQKISARMVERQDESKEQRFYRLYLAKLNGEMLSQEDTERVERILLNDLYLGARARAEQQHTFEKEGKGGEQTRK